VDFVASASDFAADFLYFPWENRGLRKKCQPALSKVLVFPRFLHRAPIFDLRQLLGDVSAELISFVSKNVLASALESEGPVVKWCREVGISPVHFCELAERGPLTREQLPINKDAAEHLSQSGVRQIQVGIIDVADMQALLVVSTAKSLTSASVQGTITELKQALEIAVFVGLHWPRSGKKSSQTKEKKGS
jgi:hypothetical protein